MILSKKLQVAVLLFVYCVASSSTALADGRNVYSKLMPITVLVDARNPSGGGYGSGFVVRKKYKAYFVMTNYHVVANENSPHFPYSYYATVKIHHPKFESGELVTNKDRYLDSEWHKKGSVVYADPTRDLAVIMVYGDLPEENWPFEERETIPIAGVSPGESIHSVGQPGASNASWVYSSGEVRQTHQQTIRFANGQAIDARIIETTSPINPGDSGGPVMNEDFKIVGVNSSYNTNSRLISNAIDSSEIRKMIAYANRHGWFRYFDLMSEIGDSAYTELVDHYEQAGLLMSARHMQQQYVEHLQKDDQSTTTANQKLAELTKQVELTSSHSYLRFNNFRRDVQVTVYYRYTNAMSQGWMPANDGWEKLVIPPMQSRMAKGNGELILVNGCTVRGVCSDGSNYKTVTSRIENKSPKTFSSFGVRDSDFR